MQPEGSSVSVRAGFEAEVETGQRASMLEVAKPAFSELSRSR